MGRRENLEIRELELNAQMLSAHIELEYRQKILLLCIYVVGEHTSTTYATFSSIGF